MVDTSIEISAIVPVSERHDDIRDLYADYRSALDSLGQSYEIIFVLDGAFPQAYEALATLRGQGEQIKVIQLAQSFGEAAAFTVGFEQALGAVIMTLPSYYQADPAEIPNLIRALDNYDMAIARRWPRTDSGLKRLQTTFFHGVLKFVAGSHFQDLGCGMRAFRRQVGEEIPLYGDQHRFLPVLADKRGFRVIEVNVAQSQRDTAPSVYHPGVYLRRILDILTVFFLVKFTKKPLRFFGLIGSAVFAFGGVLLLVVIFQRMFLDVSLANRPALLFGSLLFVLGVQLFALGLIGELIIFTHARDIKEYTVEEILQ